MIKSRRLKWAGNVACMKDKEYVQGWDDQKDSDHWEDRDLCDKILLKWILEN
jgi:hypothetical protein